MRLATHLTVPAEPSTPAHSCYSRSLRACRQTPKALTQHPSDGALDDAEIARAEPLIDTADALLARYLFYPRKDDTSTNKRDDLDPMAAVFCCC